MASEWLMHPLLRGINLDSTEYFIAQRKVLEQKEFLRLIYRDFYRQIKKNLPPRSDRVVELGSGAGFIEDFIPDVVKTDVVYQPFAHLILNGMGLPFASGSLDALVFLDVFHHIPDVASFLKQSSSALRKGGRIIMIEPWVSRWSKLVYASPNREPLDWKVSQWSFKSTGPVTGANQALPWIVFQRDLPSFKREFPDLELRKLEPMMPFRYVLSGGAMSRLGFPGFLYQTIKKVEKLFDWRINKWAMFALIVVEKLR